MKIELFQVDAFANAVFQGNPAAVCPMETEIEDAVLQKIANENNLSETAFYWKKNQSYKLRWFTPLAEVELCGHATLAAAHVLFEHKKFTGNTLIFETLSGELRVKKEQDLYIMDFPTDTIRQIKEIDEIKTAFAISPTEYWEGKTDLLVVLENEDSLMALNPDFYMLKKLNYRGIIATAAGKNCDFVSRFFAPKVGINEDPVTGSAHTTLAPFWHLKTGKKELSAIQLSSRKGFITCTYEGNRTKIAGKAVTYLQGNIFIS